MERDRQSRRSSGRAWGGIAGALVGFFGSFIAFGAVMFSRGPAAGRLFLPFFLIIPVGAVVGAIAGSQLGGWLASRSYRPTRDGAPTPSVGKGWIFAGAFAGWPLGIAIGMGLAVVLTRRIQAQWMMPIVFFSPGLLGLLLGGFAGYRVGRWRAIRQSNP